MNIRLNRHAVRSGFSIALAVLLLASATSCAPRTPGSAPVTGEAEAAPGLTPTGFLEQFGLEVSGEPVKFAVTVPTSWDVVMGNYPEGLYWGLANEFSKDAGLDLTRLKGKTMEVWRYALAGGLPGEGDSSRFRYPSNVILLVRGGSVVGAWLAFNINTIGPSVKMRNLKAITGLTLEQWTARENYFSDPGKNRDLLTLGPIEMLNEFFAAISRGDETRAEACLSPQAMVYVLTQNLSGEKRLYNPDFDRHNSFVKNITRAKLLSYRIMDPEHPGLSPGVDHPGSEPATVGDVTELRLSLRLEISWRQPEFNSPTGQTVMFTRLEKFPNGWKLTGLGTGP